MEVAERLLQGCGAPEITGKEGQLVASPQLRPGAHSRLDAAGPSSLPVECFLERLPWPTYVHQISKHFTDAVGHNLGW